MPPRLRLTKEAVTCLEDILNMGDSASVQVRHFPVSGKDTSWGCEAKTWSGCADVRAANPSAAVVAAWKAVRAKDKEDEDDYS